MYMYQLSWKTLIVYNFSNRDSIGMKSNLIVVKQVMTVCGLHVHVSVELDDFLIVYKSIYCISW